jgi:hypothetical protein
MNALPTTQIDVQALATSCGLKPSSALSGGVYIMDEAKLRAFALAAIASMSLGDVQTLAHVEVDDADLFRHPAMPAQMGSSIPN